MIWHQPFLKALIIYILLITPIFLIGERKYGKEEEVSQNRGLSFVYEARPRSRYVEEERQRLSVEHSLSPSPNSDSDLGDSLALDGIINGREDKVHSFVAKVSWQTNDWLDCGSGCRTEKLKEFLRQYDSPLENYSEDFIQTADNYNLDWRLLPAIAGCESTFGQASCGFNPFGWGNCSLDFNDYPTAISVVGRTLAESPAYEAWRQDQSLYTLAKIYKTIPPFEKWTSCVNYFMEEIAKVEVL